MKRVPQARNDEAQQLSFAISDLRERPDFFDTVANRIWRAWWEPKGHPLASIAGRLAENLRAPGIPVALVAHRGDEFLGTASLIASDLDERPNLTPWVAAVWTEPDARGKRVARALVARAAATAFQLGHATVYLCARPALCSYYQALGWLPVEYDVGERHLTVLGRSKV